MAFPVSIIWENKSRLIRPDEILGDFDREAQREWQQSPTLNPVEYEKARSFIKYWYEQGPIKDEYLGYRMTNIDLSKRTPKIHGAFARYYDNVLTQYAMEWELIKALTGGRKDSIANLSKRGTLPLREAVEALGDPILRGEGRCAELTVSTFTVFKLRKGQFRCLIWKRSSEVGLSKDLYHVVPAGMFEVGDSHDEWSVELNIWNELLEEVYDEDECGGGSQPRLKNSAYAMPPVDLLQSLIKKHKAELSVTGIACDLLNLRTEICTVLFVEDPTFSEIRTMKVNWEYQPDVIGGRFAVAWNRIDEVIEHDIRKHGMVPTGEACLELGRNWIRNRHKLK